MAIDFEIRGRLSSFDETPLFYRRHVPANSKGHLILVHGFSEHSGRYAHVAEYLGSRGYSVWAMDNRGHGRSGGQRGHVDDYGDYVKDILAFHELVARETGEKRPFLLGHSNGGLIALRFALAHAPLLKGLILSDPLLQLSKPVPALKLLAGRLIARFAPRHSMPNDLEPAELTQDPAMMEAYLADPIIFHVVSVGWFAQMEKASADARARGKELSLPLLLLLGGADPVCSGPASRAFFKSAASKDKALQTYEGFRHEIFNELGRERVLADLSAWLDRHG